MAKQTYVLTLTYFQIHISCLAHKFLNKKFVTSNIKLTFLFISNESKCIAVRLFLNKERGKKKTAKELHSIIPNNPVVICVSTNA